MSSELAGIASVELDRAQLMETLNFVVRAAVAYEREDFANRVEAAAARVRGRTVRIVILGEHKQGKSSLVNALLGLPVCPVSAGQSVDALTVVRYGETPAAAALYLAGDAADFDQRTIEEATRRRELTLDEAAAYALGATAPTVAGELFAVEIDVPAPALSGGLVIVDTPPVAGLAKGLRGLAALSEADAALFVTDAADELAATELAVLASARLVCDKVAIVMTKTDLHPAWREIFEANTRRLATAGLDVALLAVSATLRQLERSGLQGADQYSGFAALVSWLAEHVVEAADDIVMRHAADEASAVVAQLIERFETERLALTDPDSAAAVAGRLAEVRERVEEMRRRSARWNQVLSDGLADVAVDVDFDLRSRLRKLTTEAESTLDRHDPADVWPAFSDWFAVRVTSEVQANYAQLQERSAKVAVEVSQRLGTDLDMLVADLAAGDPAEALGQLGIDASLQLKRTGLVATTLTALRGTYGGIMIASFALQKFPVVIPAFGAFMAARAVREERERQLSVRRSTAKGACRRFLDEVTFVVGKHSRDTLRNGQRRQRDLFGERAEELSRSITQTLEAASAAAKHDVTSRAERLGDVEAELRRLRMLAERVRPGGAVLGGAPR